MIMTDDSVSHAMQASVFAHARGAAMADNMPRLPSRWNHDEHPLRPRCVRPSNALDGVYFTASNATSFMTAYTTRVMRSLAFDLILLTLIPRMIHALIDYMEGMRVSALSVTTRGRTWRSASIGASNDAFP